MSYRLQKNEPVEAGIKRIAREQIDRAIAEIEAPTLDSHETVHQVRKRCKKIRGLIRLVRPEFEISYREENVWYRDAARALSYVRDSHSIIETYDSLIEKAGLKPEDRKQFETVRRHLVTRRDRIAEDEVGLNDSINEFKDRLQIGRARIDFWSLGRQGFRALAGGLRKTYQRGRKAMTVAYKEPDTEHFHEWRKRVKYHWCHTRLLMPIWPPVMKAYRNEVHLLSEHLGDEHDLAVLKQTLSQNPADFNAGETINELQKVIERRREALRRDAKPLGQRIFSEKPKQMVRRLSRYWQAWHASAEQ